MPMVSIIIPVYNAEKYIHRCVDSILSQSYSDFELILIDDGSPDNCGTICDEYAKKDSRVHVIHQKNRGQAAARNVGIDWCFSNSDSQWLTFIDSDDWIHPNYLEALVGAVIDLHVNISCCRHFEVRCPEADIVPCTIPAPALVLAEEAYNSAACFKLYAREYFRDVRFPEGRIYEDAATNYKVFFRQSHVALIDAPLYYYAINTQGTTHSKWYPKRMEEFEAFEEQLSFFKDRTTHDFFAKTVRIYLYAMMGQLNSIEKDAEAITQSCHYLRLVRRKMRKVIRTNKAQVGLTIKKYPQFYESAYPRFMKLYWITKSIPHRLFSILHVHKPQIKQ